MSEAGPGSGLFRERALAHHRAPERLGTLLHASPLWLAAAFWLVLAAALAAAAVLAFGRIDVWARGRGVVREAADGAVEVVAPLPARLAGQIRRGAPLRLAIDDRPGAFLDATVVRVETIAGGRAGLRRALGDEVAELAPAGRSVVAVHAMPRAGSVEVGTSGTVEVRVGSRSVRSTLLPVGGGR